MFGDLWGCDCPQFSFRALPKQTGLGRYKGISTFSKIHRERLAQHWQDTNILEFH